MYAANALLPIVLLICCGIALRKIGLVNEVFLKTGNRFLFRLILPCTLLYNIYNIPDLSAINWRIVIFSTVGMAFLFVLGFFLTLFFVKDQAAKGVVHQVIFRTNFVIIGIPLTEALIGSSGTEIASVISAFMVPFTNALGIIVLSSYSTDENHKKSALEITRDVMKNPLILGAMCGFAVLILRAVIPIGADGNPVFTIKNNLPFLYSFLQSLNNMSTPFALIITGGLLNFKAVTGKVGYIVLGSAMRVIIAPVIGLSAAVFLASRGILPCSPADYAALIALFGGPAAVSSAIIAAEMGGDGDLARQFVVWTHILPIFTVFFTVVLFRTVGLL